MFGSNVQLRLRFITRKWPPAVGGMETYSVRMAEELGNRYALELVSLPGRADGGAPKAAALFWFGLQTAFQTPFRRKVDVALLGDMAIWPLGLLELLLGRANRLSISAHGSDVSLSIRGGLTAWFYRQYLRLGAMLLGKAQIIANSNYIGDMARRAGFSSVTVVPLGTDMRVVPGKERSDLLFVGRITRSKGLRFIVENVLPLLPADTCLRAAGTVWEDSERELLDHPSVEYLGALGAEQLAAEYSRAKVTLVPSQVAEGFGLVAVEAAACGCPVIASDSGGLAEVVRMPWGRLVPAASAEQWASAIRESLAMGSPARCELGDVAAQTVNSDHRWPIVAERTMSVISPGGRSLV
jgi:glycosyltransferase involved in cell wall biosynthesis